MISCKLYVGSPDGGPFTDDMRGRITALVARTVESFTVQDADGYYQGNPVATLIISVCCDPRRRGDIVKLGEELAVVSQQKEVALEIMPTMEITVAEFFRCRTGSYQ